MKKFKKVLLIIIGTFSIILGLIGIILPLLPTTPFLLLGATCYIRSSKKLYNALINNKWLGNYIKNFKENKSISRKTKVLSISLLWITIGYSAIFLIAIPWVKLILFFIAVGVTLHLLSFKTLPKEDQ
ncbi:YbaN family protein [Clostridium sediminicola]|uniref:YbaN family protein n=1 Tax=Clostridium sediminicola TaxID=3114879 RepID=UPI003D16E713